MKCLCILSLFVCTNAAGSDTVFFVDTEKIRQIAENAAYAKFPDIPPGGLVEDRSNRFLSIFCRSAHEMELVSKNEKDFEVCSASLQYHVKETLIERKYLDINGRCILELEGERISVSVHEDGSTRVGVGNGRSSHSEECSEEFEGWKE